MVLTLPNELLLEICTFFTIKNRKPLLSSYIVNAFYAPILRKRLLKISKTVKKYI